MANPKAVAFYVALLPSILDLEHMTLVEFLQVAGLIALILPAVLICYALSAHWARGMFRSGAALRVLNRIAATALTGAALTIVARN